MDEAFAKEIANSRRVANNMIDGQNLKCLNDLQTTLKRASSSLLALDRDMKVDLSFVADCISIFEHEANSRIMSSRFDQGKPVSYNQAVVQLTALAEDEIISVNHLAVQQRVKNTRDIVANMEEHHCPKQPTHMDDFHIKLMTRLACFCEITVQDARKKKIGDVKVRGPEAVHVMFGQMKDKFDKQILKFKDIDVLGTFKWFLSDSKKKYFANMVTSVFNSVDVDIVDVVFVGSSFASRLKSALNQPSRSSSFSDGGNSVLSFCNNK